MRQPTPQLLYDGPLFSSHSQCHIHQVDTYDITENARAGQSNGLLGAAFPTFLYIVLGCHTGEVHIRLELHDPAPPIDPCWEEVVEAPFFFPEDTWWALCQLFDGPRSEFSLPGGDYRVRYCAKDFGVHDEKCTEEGELDPLTERYLLCFWPEAPRADEILKATRPNAQYWHDVAQGKAS